MINQSYTDNIKVMGELLRTSEEGAYPLFYATTKHEIICSKCALKETDNIIAQDINWEDTINCDRCNEDIPAYREDK